MERRGQMGWFYSRGTGEQTECGEKTKRNHVSISTSSEYFSLGSRPPSLPRPASERGVCRLSETLIGQNCKFKHPKFQAMFAFSRWVESDRAVTP